MDTIFSDRSLHHEKKGVIKELHSFIKIQGRRKHTKPVEENEKDRRRPKFATFSPKKSKTLEKIQHLILKFFLFYFEFINKEYKKLFF